MSSQGQLIAQGIWGAFHDTDAWLSKDHENAIFVKGHFVTWQLQ